MKNRIDIENWRKHGDNENYIYMGVFAADDNTTSQEEIQKQVDEDYDWDQDDDDAERRGDYAHVIYYNDSFTIEDGDILEHNGRKFRVSIEEVAP
ncbi:MAG: hypothetical protein J2P56_06985 [Verrucomicrobia bacterium]|nr:hypothetical protein [Verrucomicrobiota bacterium]